MLPIKSNTTSSGCTPTSSDCVIWQGPNIPCINLCTGDSISDVTFKIAEKLCAIQGVYDLSPLQLNDLATFCTTIAGPPTGTNKTLLAVLDYIVKKVVCVNTKVDAIIPGTSYTEPFLSLPTCLRYPDPVNSAVTVTQLQTSQYTLRLGNQFCELKQVLETQIGIIAQNTKDIAELKAKSAPALPTVNPSCDYPQYSITKNSVTQMNQLLTAVEADLCSFRKAVGTNSTIAAATGKYAGSLCNVPDLSEAKSIARPTTSMAGAYSAWIKTPTTLSDSFSNLWLTVLDMRCAIDALRTCCGKVDCSKVIFAFKATTDSTRQNVTIKINGESIIDSTFSDVPNYNKILISDGNNTITWGAGTPNVFSLVAKANADTADIVIPVAGSGISGALNTSVAYTITLIGGVTKDGSSCFDKPVQTIYPSCPGLTVGLNITQTA